MIYALSFFTLYFYFFYFILHPALFQSCLQPIESQMKFAQSLEDHIVPEWRAQYLDYKLGKKKLKKLSKKPSIRATPLSFKSGQSLPNINSKNRSRGNTYRLPSNLPASKFEILKSYIPRIPINSDGNATNNEVIIDDESHPEHDDYDSDLGSYKTRHNEDQHTVQTFSNSFALPGAAIGYKTDTMYGSANDIPPNTVPNDSIGENEMEYDQTPLLKPQTNTEFPFNKRKSSVVALFDAFKRSPSLSINKGGNNNNGNDGDSTAYTELEDLANYAREQFIAWVDSELDKVELFYKEKEDSCVERFLILQDQVIQLENQKLMSKRKWLHAKKMLKMQKSISSSNNSIHHSITSENIDGEGDGDGDVEDDFDDDDDEEDDDFNGYEEYINSGFLSGYNNVNHGVIGLAHRNFKLLSFWTRRKLRIINKFDMPSLPTFEWLKKDGKVEKQYYDAGYYSDDESEPVNGINDPSSAHIRDFQRRKKHEKSPNIPYFVARRMIKKAVYELYRSMELLKSYKLMNRIAFRKLIKKYDKTTNDSILNSYMAKIEESYFSKSDVLDNVMTNVEELYTRYFENGNRKVSITKLRTNVAERTYYLSDYISGLFLGVSIPLIVYTMYYGIHQTIIHQLPNGKFLLQIWGGFFAMVLMGWLFSINCLVWTKYKVNYKFIFEFNQHDALDFKEYMVLPSLFFFLGGLISWFSFQNFWPTEFSGYDFPWIFLAVGIAIILCPFDIMFLNARLWLLSTLTRLLLSGLYPVEFRDFFLGDILCSLTYSISNVSMFFCIYARHWVDCDGCGSSRSRLLGFLQCLPSIWRFLQCFRRYADTGDWFPHLANMLKYSISTVYYMSLSLYRIETINKYRILLIFWAIINSVYSSLWDIMMDWSLFQFDSKYFLLRDEIAFKSPNFYYFAIIIDVILRFQWVFYVLFPRQIQQSAITSFAIAVAEVLRRFIWIFFRMENEHATNVHLFRASRESPLPYPVYKKKANPIPSVKTTGFDDGNSKDLSEQDIRKRNALPHIRTPPLSFTRDSEHGNLATGSHLIPGTFDIENRGGDEAIRNSDDKAAGYSSGALFSAVRYLRQVSKTMRAAHIKDFQRRKVRKTSMEDQDATPDVGDAEME